jgi:hypothetical protein
MLVTLTDTLRDPDCFEVPDLRENQLDFSSGVELCFMSMRATSSRRPSMRSGFAAAG